MEIDEVYKKKIIALINVFIPDAKIYLFGSHARKTATPGSDIDIALDAGKPLDRSAVGEIRSVFGETNIPFMIDVVDFHAVPKDMQNMILQERVIWKS